MTKNGQKIWNVYNDCKTTQTRCAREIRDISDGKSKIQQSVVSRMLCKTYLPKEPVTLQAIKSWMTMKGKGKYFRRVNLVDQLSLWKYGNL